jgi:hypothetical protein
MAHLAVAPSFQKKPSILKVRTILFMGTVVAPGARDEGAVAVLNL